MPPAVAPVVPSLLAALASVPDHRRAAGRRHALPAVLTFVCCGMLCGCMSWLAWPGLQQVCRLVQQTGRRGRWQIEVHDKLTSLPPQRAGPADVLRLSRRHWAIENELHSLRDVTLGEDASRIRSGAAPQVMAALRNLSVAVRHRQGMTNRAAGVRHFAWQLDQAAQVLGLPCPSLPAAARAA